MVLAPEHDLVETLTTPDRKADVDAYIAAAARQTEIERTAADKAKTGVFTGSYCVNPFDGARVPIYVGDYVLAGYGTGAVMGVPAHDERDFEFATKVRPRHQGRDRAPRLLRRTFDRGVRRRRQHGQLRPLRRHVQRRRQDEGR